MFVTAMLVTVSLMHSHYGSCLQTARLKVSRGLVELDVPLRMKAGPTVMLRMKAILLTPDLQLSSNTLAFGPVQTGKSKVNIRGLYPSTHHAAFWSHGCAVVTSTSL